MSPKKKTTLTDDAALVRAQLYALICLERGDEDKADTWIRKAADLAAKIDEARP